MCQDVMLVKERLFLLILVLVHLKALDCIVMCFWFMNNQQS
ncbi:unnamed protein product [Callosobruchus maculatus]|uniref:Uncharacterized protein n=1 Tax=Callosobruchus maculatus TaxID=64391 RepID=A0A653BRW0_CALMS|nr:unnamed protein product [Callosobruchus maculatus]